MLGRGAHTALQGSGKARRMSGHSQTQPESEAAGLGGKSAALGGRPAECEGLRREIDADMLIWLITGVH